MTVVRAQQPGATSSRHHREREIAEVLVRYELSHLANVLGLERVVSALDGLTGRKPPGTRTEPENLRLALEELGPTFIKLGQLLSTRTDLLSLDYRVELTKLQDTAPAVPSEEVKEIVERELHAPVDTTFAIPDAVPLACASVGQAHTATLHDGTYVVVKVRSPNVVEEMEQDFEIIQNFAAWANRHWKAAARYDVVGLADEFVHALRAQLDYLQERRNANRFQANFAADPLVLIPRVFPDLTTSRVITLERIRGMKIADLAALDEAASTVMSPPSERRSSSRRWSSRTGSFTPTRIPATSSSNLRGGLASSTSGWSGRSTTGCASSCCALSEGFSSRIRAGLQTLCSRSAPRPRRWIETYCART